MSNVYSSLGSWRKAKECLIKGLRVLEFEMVLDKQAADHQQVLHARILQALGVLLVMKVLMSSIGNGLLM